VLGEQPLIKTAMDSGKSLFDAEIELAHMNQNLAIRSAQPIKDHSARYSALL
jgi:hypothetical protein